MNLPAHLAKQQCRAPQRPAKHKANALCATLPNRPWSGLPWFRSEGDYEKACPENTRDNHSRRQNSAKSRHLYYRTIKSSATRRTGRNDGHRDAPAGFAAARGKTSFQLSFGVVGKLPDRNNQVSRLALRTVFETIDGFLKQVLRRSVNPRLAPPRTPKPNSKAHLVWSDSV
jgi:hypothetical protein